jgi:hypothetical protein
MLAHGQLKLNHGGRLAGKHGSTLFFHRNVPMIERLLNQNVCNLLWINITQESACEHILLIIIPKIGA